MKDTIRTSTKNTLNIKVAGELTVEQVKDKFGDKTTCYLTGTPIDLKTDEYHFDHIVPICKDGTCNNYFMFHNCVD